MRVNIREKNNLVVALLGLILLVVFYWAYQAYVIDRYAYLGFGSSQITTVKILGILSFISLLYLATNNIGVGMLVTVMPATIVAAQEWQTDVAVMLIFYTMFLSCAFYRSKGASWVPQTVLPSFAFYILTAVVFCAFIVTSSFVFLTSVDQIYELREVRNNESTGSISFIIENTFTKIFLPVAIFLIISKRGLSLNTGVIVVGIALALFVITTRKSLFVVTIFPLIFPIFHLSKEKFLKLVLCGFSILTFLAVTLADTPANFFFSTFLRRLFFTPVMVLDGYTSYFQDHDFTLFTHTFLKALSPEYLYLPTLISEYYFGVEYNANTGAIGNSFAGGGFVGVAVIGFVLGALMYFFIDGQRRHYAYFPAVIFFFSVITNNDIFVLFTAHGFAVLFLLRFIRLPGGLQDVQFFGRGVSNSPVLQRKPLHQ